MTLQFAISSNSSPYSEKKITKVDEIYYGLHLKTGGKFPCVRLQILSIFVELLHASFLTPRGKEEVQEKRFVSKIYDSLSWGLLTKKRDKFAV